MTVARGISLTFEDDEACARYFSSISKAHEAMPFKGLTSIEQDWHTPHELYEHRYTLWHALCFSKPYRYRAWRSKLHRDGTMFEDSFITGINLKVGDWVWGR